MAEQQDQGFKAWAILEVMGHRRLAGEVSEQQIAGAGFIRIDVPLAHGGTATQFYSPSSVYCLTPTTEEIARAVAVRNQPQPVQHYELPAARTGAQREAPGDSEFDEEYD